MVFIKGNIQHPMQLIFDAPMRTNRAQNAFGTGDTGNMIAVLTTFVLSNPALCTDAGYRQEVLPVGKAAQVLQDVRVRNGPAFADLHPSMTFIDRFIIVEPIGGVLAVFQISKQAFNLRPVGCKYPI